MDKYVESLDGIVQIIMCMLQDAVIMKARKKAYRQLICGGKLLVKI